MVTVEEYLKKAHTTVKLPSGFEFKVKTLSAVDVLEHLGDIPLTQDILNNPSDNVEYKKDLLHSPEYVKKFVEIIPELVEKSIIEPKGIKWEQLDGRDKDVLMEFVLSQFTVNKNVASFREEEQ